MHLRPQAGVILLLVLVLAAVAMACVAALAIAAAGAGREQASERALAQAREALLAYAADRPIDSRVGPGYLPCPDLDDDGWAEATCGSLTGDLGQAERLGACRGRRSAFPTCAMATASASGTRCPAATRDCSTAPRAGAAST